MVVLGALLALAAGTAGDVPSLVERIDAARPFADGTRAKSVPSTTTPPPTTTTSTPAPLAWTLYAGGDVLMDRSEPAGRDPFVKLVPALAEADVALVNVEMVIAEGGAAEDGKEFVFRAPPSAATTLASSGVDVANLGNNHSRDFGPDALEEMIGLLRGAGVQTVGAGTDAAGALAPAVFRLGTDAAPVSVAILGASANVPAGWMAGAQPGIATTRGDALIEAVVAARREHDVVIVTVHWGDENAPCPNDAQVTIGDALIAAGASAVIGHHPHVLQPIVERGGGLIAYSLGNFAWHSRSGPQGDTGLLELRFLGADLDGFTFHPHVLDANGDPEPAGLEPTGRIEAAISPNCDLVLAT